MSSKIIKDLIRSTRNWQREVNNLINVIDDEGTVQMYLKEKGRLDKLLEEVDPYNNIPIDPNFDVTTAPINSMRDDPPITRVSIDWKPFCDAMELVANNHSQATEIVQSIYGVAENSKEWTLHVTEILQNPDGTVCVHHN